MIFVTGSSGLVGSHLLLKLVQQNEPVRAMVRSKKRIDEIQQVFSFYVNNSKELINKINWVEGDVTDVSSVYEAMQDCDFVYHCAAYVSFDPKRKNLLYKTNIDGTRNVVNACLELKIKKLVHVSSVASLGLPASGNTVNEDCIWKSSKNKSHYSISKFVSEMEVWRGIEEGLNAVIVNPSYIIGPGNWKKSSANIFPKAHKGIPAYTLGVTGFVDVRDVVDCMIKLMESTISNERFILNSENISFKKFFDLCSVSVGKKGPGIGLNKSLLALAWRIEAIRSRLFRVTPFVTRETAHTAISQKHYSNNKIMQQLGMPFLPVFESINYTGSIFLKTQLT